LYKIGLVEVVGLQNLKCDGTSGYMIASAVNRTHAAATEFLDDFKMGETAPNGSGFFIFPEGAFVLAIV
jgi:hypothetical protein